jgi:hypothetical protein
MDIKLFSAVIAIVALSACGGGSDAPPPDVADKYAGTWVACDPHNSIATGSVGTTIKLGKLTATSMSYEFGQTIYVSSTNCSGTGTAGYSEAGGVAYNGTTTASSELVDKDDVSVTTVRGVAQTAPVASKDVSLVVGNKMHLGYFYGARDAQGYPTLLGSRTYIKQ